MLPHSFPDTTNLGTTALIYAFHDDVKRHVFSPAATLAASLVPLELFQCMLPSTQVGISKPGHESLRHKSFLHSAILHVAHLAARKLTHIICPPRW